MGDATTQLGETLGGFFLFLRLIDDRAVAVLVVPGCLSLLALLAAGLLLAACLLCRRRCVVRGRGRWPYCIIYVYFDMCVYIYMCMLYWGPAETHRRPGARARFGFWGAVAAITLRWTGWRGPRWSFGGGRERKVWKGEIT